MTDGTNHFPLALTGLRRPSCRDAGRHADAGAVAAILVDNDRRNERDLFGLMLRYDMRTSNSVGPVIVIAGLVIDPSAPNDQREQLF